MQYLPLFLLFMAVLIAAYFYLQRAKARDARAASTTSTTTEAPSPAPPSDTTRATTDRPTE